MNLGADDSLVLSVEFSTAEAAEIERRAEACGMTLKEFVKDGSWASFCRARKALNHERQVEAEKRKRVERAQVHEAAELFVQMCKDRPNGVGKGWRKGKTSPKRDHWGNAVKVLEKKQ